MKTKYDILDKYGEVVDSFTYIQNAKNRKKELEDIYDEIFTIKLKEEKDETKKKNKS